MKNDPKKKSRAVPVDQAYDLCLLQEVEEQLALARELAEYAKEIQFHIAQLEKAIGSIKTNQTVNVPEKVH